MVFSLSSVLVACVLAPAAPTVEPLEALITRLETLQEVSFTYRRILDYKSSGYHHDGVSNLVVVFNSGEGLPVTQFRIESKEQGTTGFDGKSLWNVHPETHQLHATERPKGEAFDSLSSFRNSIVGLARSLRASLKAQPGSIQTESSSEKVVVLNWNCEKARPTISVPLEPMGVSTRLRLEIDKATWLPRKIVQFLERDGDTITTEFSNWNLKPIITGSMFSPP